MPDWLGFGLSAVVAIALLARWVVASVRTVEKRIDSLWHTVYDPEGTNGLVRRMKALEGETLTTDEIKMVARHEARGEGQKVIETLERIYEGKRRGGS